VQRNDITLFKNKLESTRLHSGTIKNFRWNKRVYPQHVCPKTFDSLGHALTDATKSDDPYSEATELSPGKGVPLEISYLAVTVCDMAKTIQHERERKISYRTRVSSGRIGHNNAPVPGCLEVHCIDTHPVASNHLEMRSLIHVFRCDGSGTHNPSLCGGKMRGQLG
jgi:hypothetical protein